MHTTPEPYTGDEPLYCHIGAHVYENTRCKHCGRKQHLIVFDQQSGPAAATTDPQRQDY